MCLGLPPKNWAKKPLCNAQSKRTTQREGNLKTVQKHGVITYGPFCLRSFCATGKIRGPFVKIVKMNYFRQWPYLRNA